MRALLTLLLFPLASLAAATPLPPAARSEVDALLGRLQASGCEFNRNGSWYAGAEAKAHLLKKLEYLEGKDLVKTTEQFIERGASASSMSGKAYLVRCPGKAPVDSATWLTAELQQLRAARPASGPR
ncbi:DUF5329 domain-containing protein [Pelomonas cellulosilytica]|uniref:DUF5329 domain-containing protein n=1 Tax=Pelomonas cellulosilytica TaxID=2906762 RepID=A0ABS8XLE2_9BURK|nr:DUF5329 domain-containing protein [Pelomonas sp. P8]MCE4553622.1 DUF5329 domain-containing protein [Pelomonas sp. P8]